MEFLVWIGIIGVILMLLYFGVGAYAAMTLTKVGDHPQYHQDPGTYGLDFETVYFHSRKDHLRLAGWYVPKEGAQRVIILVHGRNASKQNAISGNLPKLASELHAAGFAVLMMDLRGHGESEGKRYTFGVLEQRDVLGAVDFLLDKGYAPGHIGLLGISLGGAATIGAAAEEPAIGALVVESTFSDLTELVEPNWKKESGLPLFFLPGVYLMWQILYGFDMHDVRPVEAIKRVTPRLILIMHSQSDEIIPVEHAHQLAKAVPHAHLVLLDHCDHAELFRDQPQAYLKALVPFLETSWR